MVPPSSTPMNDKLEVGSDVHGSFVLRIWTSESPTAIRLFASLIGVTFLTTTPPSGTSYSCSFTAKASFSYSSMNLCSIFSKIPNRSVCNCIYYCIVTMASSISDILDKLFSTNAACLVSVRSCSIVCLESFLFGAIAPHKSCRVLIPKMHLN